MRRGRCQALAALVVCGLCAPLAVGTALAAAPGKVKVGVDRKARVSFSVDGRVIDVRLRPRKDGKPNPLVADLSGASIVIACRGRSPKHRHLLVTDLQTMWPSATDLYRMKLPRDASDDMQWCVLEQVDGTDIAVTRKLRTPKPADEPVPVTTP